MMRRQPHTIMQATNTADVTAVIPCYRCAASIDRAVASVAAQTLRPAEVIVVDDGSADATVYMLHKLQESYGGSWLRILTLPENLGPSAARNAGWEAATQPYIAFLDADDAWHPRKIEIQFRWMRSHPEVALTGHACHRIRVDHGRLGAAEWGTERDAFTRVSKWALLSSNRFPTRSVMVKRSVPHRFAAEKRHSEDYLLWLQIMLSGLPCYRSELPLASLYKAEYGEAGLSADLSMMEKGELDTYHRIFLEGHIGVGTLAASVLWSIVRYIRRRMAQGFATGRR